MKFFNSRYYYNVFGDADEVSNEILWKAPFESRAKFNMKFHKWIFFSYKYVGFSYL